MKEIGISIIVIVIVVVGNLGIQKFLNNSSDKMAEMLNELKIELEKEGNEFDIEIAKQQANNIYEEWEDLQKKWSVIVIHDELDKIELSLIGVKSALNANSKEDSMQEIEKSIFLVEHIKEKESFKLKNIF